jgi:hypothetical protein
MCDEKLVSFFWIDAISERVERSPNLIAEHLPTVWKRLEGLSLVKNWQLDDREPVRNVTTWVNFDGRDSVKQVIKQHLCGTDKNRLLHVAGLSGSGKTRTVIQACKDEPALAGVVYCPALSDSVDRLLTHLNAKSGSALLIIDEVPLDDYEFLARRVERMPATVRVVSIGPGRANERQREGILILAPYRELASAVAVDILHLIYSHNPVRDPTLAAVVLRILADATVTLARNGWYWVQLAKAVQSHDPKAICRLAVNQLVESRHGLDDSLNKFVAECARSEPDEAMAVVADVFADKKKRWIFRTLVFRSLFDSIGVPAVSRYLEAHPDHAPFIARHLDSPSNGEGGNLQVPELADWLMSRFSENTEVWNEFMMGRHAFEVFRVPDGYEAAKAIAFGKYRLTAIEDDAVTR